MLHVDWFKFCTVKCATDHFVGLFHSKPICSYCPRHDSPDECFCKVFLSSAECFLSWAAADVFPSVLACVAVVTQVSPRRLHRRWSRKLNGAEWSSDVGFFSIEQHLVRTPCFFSPLLDWLSRPTFLRPPPSPTSYPGRCLAQWDIIATEIEAMTLTHKHTQAGNESGFRSDSMKSCLSEEETAAWIELSVRGNSCLALFIPLCENGWVARISFTLSNVNPSFGSF